MLFDFFQENEHYAQKCKTYEAQIQELKCEKEEFQKKLSEYNDHFEEMKSKVSMLEDRCNLYKVEIDSLLEDKEEVKHQFKTKDYEVNEEVENLSAELKKCRNELLSTNGKKTNLKKALELAYAENEKLSEKCNIRFKLNRKLKY